MGFLTCEGRLAYAYRLFEPDQRVDSKTGSSTDVYSTCFLIEKTKENQKWLKEFNLNIQKAKEKGTSKGMFPKKAWNTLKMPLRDGDEEVKAGDKPDEFKGHWFFNANQSQRRPSLRYKNEAGKIVPVKNDDPNGDEIIYSGCHAILAISVYPYNASGQKGIAVGLEGVLKVRDGDRLDGRMNVDEAFKEFEEEVEDSYEDVTGFETEEDVW